MPERYESHRDFMQWAGADANRRQATVETALREAFSPFIEKREVETVVFSSMSAMDLANAIVAQPLILKPVLACCNIAGRALERDLDMRNVDTYCPHLTEDQAKILAGYIKPFLPPYLELPVLSRIDRVYYVDKEIRKRKGAWERQIVSVLNRLAQTRFRKRKFEVDGEKFELDAAAPEEGDILIGIDIKRIEARRDIHKRCDEIVNKAGKLKRAFPDAKFGAVIYYPFIEEHVNVQNRLHSPEIAGVVFASQSDTSTESAVKMLLPILEAPSR